MSKKYFIYSVLIFVMIFAIAGCGTVPKKFKEEVGGIKTRVETLETRVEGVETKQAEVERATGEQAQTLEELKASAVKTNISTKQKGPYTKRRIKEIQTCLKNAGFYDGKIDGVRGKKTRKAIREFQKANGVVADGVVGKKTSELLNKYAQGSPAGAASTEEGTGK